MKLLVDTSVWSLALRRKNTASLSPDEQKLKAELVQAIQDGRVAMLGLLRQELLSGIKEKAQFDKVKAALGPYLDEPINTALRDDRSTTLPAIGCASRPGTRFASNSRENAPTDRVSS